MEQPRVVVVGGSLGGLTAALVLRDAGCDVDVLERSATPLEGRGAGIVLHPVTVRYLTERLGRPLQQVGSVVEVLRYLDEDGHICHEQPARYRFSSYSWLHQALMQGFDASRFHLRAEVVDVAQDADVARVTTADGRTFEADLVVCADGIHSPSRRRLLPGLVPRYAGYVGWRGTVNEAELSPATFEALRSAITYAVVPRSHILSYPIQDLDGSLREGARLTNWVWYRNTPADRLDELLTDRDGVRHEMSLAAGGVTEANVAELRQEAERVLSPPLAELVRGTVEPFVQAVFDIEVPRMAFGRVCLVGDAAFALRPHIAAGTAKAADDAWTLADALRETGGDVAAALARWEPGRLDLGRRAVARTIEAGERSQVTQTWRVGDPLPFGLEVAGDSLMPA